MEGKGNDKSARMGYTMWCRALHYKRIEYLSRVKNTLVPNIFTLVLMFGSERPDTPPITHISTGLTEAPILICHISTEWRLAPVLI
jgi:hypothetical protein